MSWSLWPFVLADLTIWTVLFRYARGLCWGHAMMFSGGLTTLLGLVVGTGAPLGAIWTAAGMVIWWIGGGCYHRRFRRWKAALGNLAGEMRRAAMSKTMRERAVPVASPA